MNKKIIFLILMLTMMTGVFAQGGGGGGSVTCVGEEECRDAFLSEHKILEERGYEIGIGTLEFKVQSRIRGLEGAQLKVQNQEQLQHMEQVMNQINFQARVWLNNASFEEDCPNSIESGNATCKVLAKAVEQKKFLNFAVEREAHYDIGEDGSVMKRNRLFDFLFRDV